MIQNRKIKFCLYGLVLLTLFITSCGPASSPASLPSTPTRTSTPPGAVVIATSTPTSTPITPTSTPPSTSTPVTPAPTASSPPMSGWALEFDSTITTFNTPLFFVLQLKATVPLTFEPNEGYWFGQAPLNYVRIEHGQPPTDPGTDCHISNVDGIGSTLKVVSLWLDGNSDLGTTDLTAVLDPGEPKEMVTLTCTTPQAATETTEGKTWYGSFVDFHTNDLNTAGDPFLIGGVVRDWTLGGGQVYATKIYNQTKQAGALGITEDTTIRLLRQ